MNRDLALALAGALKKASALQDYRIEARRLQREGARQMARTCQRWEVQRAALDVYIAVRRVEELLDHKDSSEAAECAAIKAKLRLYMGERELASI